MCVLKVTATNSAKTAKKSYKLKVNQGAASSFVMVDDFSDVEEYIIVAELGTVSVDVEGMMNNTKSGVMRLLYSEGVQHILLDVIASDDDPLLLV